VGRGAIRFYLPLNAQLPNPFFAQLVLVTKNVDARIRVQDRLEKLLTEEFPDVVARISPLELGPPVGWPLQWRVSGPDNDEVAKIAQKVAQVIGTEPDARHINYDWLEPARQLRIKVDQEQVRRLGISSADLATVLNAAITGSTVTQVRDDIYLVNVVARAVETERGEVSTLRALQVPIAGGRTVPLTQFASFEYGQEYPLIWRRNRLPTLTVRADVRPGVLPASVVAGVEPRIVELNATLAKPYKIELGGVAEESAESQASVFAVVPLMLLLMATVLMFALQSFRRLAIVLALLPLGIVGVVLALLVFGRPLGFVAILGVLSLLGMIAKNAVILIVQIETDRREGLRVRDAVMQASSSRLRPMMLTAISTVLGLIPIAPTVFWGPMAFAIMGGLLLATLLTLVFLPTVYLTVFAGDDASEPRVGASMA
jgi:multidrug efflux pump subunit AcrB